MDHKKRFVIVVRLSNKNQKMDMLLIT